MMSMLELLGSGTSAALILAATVAGSRVLLVLIVLISPSSTRGKAARDLLGLLLSKSSRDGEESEPPSP